MVTTRSSSSRERTPSIDDCDDGAMVSRTKRSKKSRHSSAFLSGVDISEQLDPLSFPDPPTPQPIAINPRPPKPPPGHDPVEKVSNRSSRRNRRRSSAVFVPHSNPALVEASKVKTDNHEDNNNVARKSKACALKDLTNQGNNHSSNGVLKDSMVKSDSKQSMGKLLKSSDSKCLPGCDNEQVQHATEDENKMLLSSSDMECNSPEYDTRSKRKSRKKRHSILDPSECKALLEISSPVVDGGTTAAASKSKKRRQSIELPSQNEALRHELLAVSPVGTSNTECNEDILAINLSYEEQVNLVNSVRKFSSLDICDRAGSTAERDIIALTGYPVNSWTQVATADVKQKGDRPRSGLDLNWSSSPTQQRRLKTNKEKRDLLSKLLGPFVQRMERRKKEDVASIEAATGCKAERVHGCYKYKEIRSGKLIEATEYEKRYRKYLASCAAKLHTEKTPCLDQHKVNENIPELNGDANDSVGRQSDGSDMDTSATDEILSDSVNQSSVGSPENSSEESAQRDDDSLCNNLLSPTQMSVDAGDELLPFPSRDDVSANPEIAAAEIRLWNKIDAALEEYSMAVLNIRRAQEGSGMV